MCGGTRVTSGLRLPRLGLSPRVRGNRHNDYNGSLGYGSIPACAGEPNSDLREFGRDGVYPRVCGGTATLSTDLVREAGLSPRVRGNPFYCGYASVGMGSIPACAGEPSKTLQCPVQSRVYPRVCGGTDSICLLPRYHRGLSPRVRGNPHDGVDGQWSVGSIPACAGEPSGSRGESSWRRVYPRVCGGTRSTRPSTLLAKGLSPRVRGNHPRVPRFGRKNGSIPACAGEPSSIARKTPVGRVYPRVCGGTHWCLLLSLLRYGLSPRVRGNRKVFIFCACWSGSIPACAGEPG